MAKELWMLSLCIRSSWNMPVISVEKRDVEYLTKMAGLAPHHNSGPKATFKPFMNFFPSNSNPNGVFAE